MYWLVESWSAHKFEDMDKSLVNFEGAKAKLLDFWENDDLWGDTFSDEEDYENHLKKIEKCTDEKELCSMLDGIGYFFLDKSEIKEEEC